MQQYCISNDYLCNRNNVAIIFFWIIKLAGNNTAKTEIHEELEDQVDDMWYSFAIADFENNPAYEVIAIDVLIE